MNVDPFGAALALSGAAALGGFAHDLLSDRAARRDAICPTCYVATDDEGLPTRSWRVPDPDPEEELREKHAEPPLTCDGCAEAKESTRDVATDEASLYLCDECDPDREADQ